MFIFFLFFEGLVEFSLWDEGVGVFFVLFGFYRGFSFSLVFRGFGGLYVGFRLEWEDYFEWFLRIVGLFFFIFYVGVLLKMKM